MKLWRETQAEKGCKLMFKVRVSQAWDWKLHALHSLVFCQLSTPGSTNQLINKPLQCCSVWVVYNKPLPSRVYKSIKITKMGQPGQLTGWETQLGNRFRSLHIVHVFYFYIHIFVEPEQTHILKTGNVSKQINSPTVKHLNHMLLIQLNLLGS